MSNLRQAAQSFVDCWDSGHFFTDRHAERIRALRAALAEPEQEPVAWISEGGDVSRSKRYMDEMGFKCNPLYTTPPQRKHNNGVIAERQRIVNLLMIQHEAAKGAHNYWHVAAQLIQAEVASDT